MLFFIDAFKSTYFDTVFIGIYYAFQRLSIYIMWLNVCDLEPILISYTQDIAYKIYVQVQVYKITWIK